MADKIEINASEFVTVVGEGKKISFSSTDGMEYILDCGQNDLKTDPKLPLTIPADGKKQDLKIESDPGNKSYKLVLTKKSSKGKDDSPRPTMIIKVE